LIWTDDEQQLRSGYLRSRETAQLLAVRSAKSSKTLDLQATQPGQLQATNHLGVEVLHVVARDRNGDYFQGTSLADGATQKLISVADYNAAVMPLAKVYNDCRPSPPLGYETNSYSVGLFGFRESYGYNYYYGGNADGNLPPPTFQASILETELRRATVGNRELEPGTYFAIVNQSPEMPFGCQRVTERGSLHAVLGDW
jgi:hypothetical protein